MFDCSMIDDVNKKKNIMRFLRLCTIENRYIQTNINDKEQEPMPPAYPFKSNN